MCAVVHKQERVWTSKASVHCISIFFYVKLCDYEYNEESSISCISHFFRCVFFLLFECIQTPATWACVYFFWQNYVHLHFDLLPHTHTILFFFFEIYIPLSRASSAKALKISNSNKNILLHSSQSLWNVCSEWGFLHSVKLLSGVFSLLSLQA